LPQRPAETCPQCDQVLEPSFVFCPACGQKRIQEEESLKSLITSFLGDYFAYDSKLMKSLRPLLFKPGFLSLQYLAGKRVNYIPPLRLYIFISIIFFVVLSLSGNSNSSELDSSIWDSFFQDYLPRVFFLLLPMFAGIQNILFRRFKRGYVFHLVSSLHFHSFLFLLLIAYLLLSRFLVAVGMGYLNVYILSVCGLLAGFYLFKSLKKLFVMKTGRSLANFTLLLLIYGILVSSILMLILGYIALRT